MASDRQQIKTSYGFGNLTYGYDAKLTGSYLYILYVYLFVYVYEHMCMHMFCKISDNFNCNLIPKDQERTCNV